MFLYVWLLMDTETQKFVVCKSLNIMENPMLEISVSHPNQLTNSKHLLMLPEPSQVLSVGVISSCNHGEDCVTIQTSRRHSSTPFTMRAGHKSSLTSCLVKASWLFMECCVASRKKRQLSGRQKCGRKSGTSKRESVVWRGLSCKIHSRIWWKITGSGLELESVQQESQHTDQY